VQFTNTQSSINTDRTQGPVGAAYHAKVDGEKYRIYVEKNITSTIAGFDNPHECSIHVARLDKMGPVEVKDNSKEATAVISQVFGTIFVEDANNNLKTRAPTKEEICGYTISTTDQYPNASTVPQ